MKLINRIIIDEYPAYMKVPHPISIKTRQDIYPQTRILKDIEWIIRLVNILTERI